MTAAWGILTDQGIWSAVPAVAWLVVLLHAADGIQFLTGHPAQHRDASGPAAVEPGQQQASEGWFRAGLGHHREDELLRTVICMVTESGLMACGSM